MTIGGSDTLMEVMRALALEAGAAIMAIYEGGALETHAKPDGSPVTAADLAADRIIVAGLETAFPDIPVVTEERAASHDIASARHFLVDPLDGTKEFVERRGEFTVNIALVEHGAPTAGVVYAPALGRLFRGDVTTGAVEETCIGPGSDAWTARAIAAVEPDDAALRVVASKSHRDAATDALIACYAVADFKAAGSSLKFCLVASGDADFYPRIGRTMEWDTAAAHAVLAAAGGAVVRADNGAPLVYGKPGRANPGFVAFGRRRPSQRP